MKQLFGCYGNTTPCIFGLEFSFYKKEEDIILLKINFILQSSCMHLQTSLKHLIFLHEK